MNLPLIAAAVLLAAEAWAVDESKPYGRVCITVGDAAAKTEAVLSEDERPGSERKAMARLDANSACEVVVAVFAKGDGALAHGWRPALVSLGEWEEQMVPAARDPWVWTKGGAFELFVAFFPKEAPGAARVVGLVAQLREGAAPAVAKLQARQLREELRKWMAEDAAAGAKPESAPAPVGGTTRGAGKEFRWRDHARKVNFSAEKPGVVVFRYDGAR